MSDWELEGVPPVGDIVNTYQVWIGGAVRSVQRVGPQSVSLNPGTLVFTDCVHPAQNVICDETEVRAWRITGACIAS